MYGGEVIRERIWEIGNKVWREESWSEGAVVPIVKTGEGEKVENYRGVTLAQTAYKIYAAALAERLKKKIEEKGILPPNQTGFRKGGSMRKVGVREGLVEEMYGGFEGNEV